MYKGHKGGGGGGVKEIIDYHGLLVDYWNFIQCTIIKNKHVNWLHHLKLIIT